MLLNRTVITNVQEVNPEYLMSILKVFGWKFSNESLLLTSNFWSLNSYYDVVQIAYGKYHGKAFIPASMVIDIYGTEMGKVMYGE